MRNRSFGAVYKAYKVDRWPVAIKKVTYYARVEDECNLLLGCNSQFTVRIYEILHLENELWVMTGEKC